MSLGWYSTTELSNRGWKCGYCGRDVGGNVGYRRGDGEYRTIYICPHCENPTAFIVDECGAVEQYPGPVRGNEVEHLPDSISSIYGEVRRCIQYTAYTAAVLAMRKLLMHVAVEQGAEEGMRFVQYVDYLDENHWIPPNGRDWVDAIRKTGNEATHEIVIASENDANRLLDFVEMLLKLVYEFPAKLKNR